MNIFWLDRDVKRSAVYACDQHIVKMITEHTQQLCTALNNLGMHGLPMRPTHASHPCVLWVAEEFANFVYLVELNHAYYAEYCNRYGKRGHMGYSKMLHLLDTCTMRTIRSTYRQANADAHGVSVATMRAEPTRWITTPPQTMPEELRVAPTGTKDARLNKVVSAYRSFYRERKLFARWLYSNPPSFMRQQ